MDGQVLLDNQEYEDQRLGTICYSAYCQSNIIYSEFFFFLSKKVDKGKLTTVK